MRNIIATTALSLMMSTSVFAASSQSDLKVYQQNNAEDIHASEFIGMRVYSAEADYDGLNQDSEVSENDAREWDDIGEINDVILGRDGEVKAVILGVGGFIGINEKDVAVDMSSIKFVNESDDEGDFFLVVKTNKESLESADAYQEQSASRMNDSSDSENTAQMDDDSNEQNTAQMDDTSNEQNTAQMDGENSDVDTTQTSATDNQAGNRERLRRPMFQVDGYSDAEEGDLTAEALTGARVYGANNEDMGEVDQLIVNTDGEIEQAVLDIGGFLGLGEHRIAVTLEEIQIKRTEAGNDFRVYIDATQSELESQPEYEG